MSHPNIDCFISLLDTYASFSDSYENQRRGDLICQFGSAIEDDKLWEVGKTAYDYICQSIDIVDGLSGKKLKRFDNEMISDLMKYVLKVVLEKSTTLFIEGINSSEIIVSMEKEGQKFSMSAEQFTRYWADLIFILKVHCFLSYPISIKNGSSKFNFLQKLSVSLAIISGIDHYLNVIDARESDIDLIFKIQMLYDFLTGKKISSERITVAENASKAAMARHAHHYDQRDRVLELYEILKSNPHFTSRASFARKIAQDRSITVTERTIDGYLRDYLGAQ